jgi:hypothetical protein
VSTANFHPITELEFQIFCASLKGDASSTWSFGVC